MNSRSEGEARDAEQRRALKERKELLRRELNEIDAKLAYPDQAIVDRETNHLRKLFWITEVVLCGTLVSSLAALLYLPWLYSCLLDETYFIATLAGITGSSISALVSANARYAAGYEFSDGTPYPDQSKKERFNSRLVAGFVTRPLLGAVCGPLVILALAAGLFGSFDLTNHLNVALWSGMGGLLAKTLLDKLKDVFANILGVKR